MVARISGVERTECKGTQKNICRKDNCGAEIRVNIGQFLKDEFREL